jgi:hypothetical protein
MPIEGLLIQWLDGQHDPTFRWINSEEITAVVVQAVEQRVEVVRAARTRLSNEVSCRSSRSADARLSTPKKSTNSLRGSDLPVPVELTREILLGRLMFSLNHGVARDSRASRL